MKYQEQFPTIWDTPLKTTKQQPKQASGKTTAPLKETFLTIWDSAKHKQAV